jgi:hypothetical protein
MPGGNNVFRNTLIYTVVLNAVRGLVAQRTETELFLLVLIFSIVVFLTMKLDALTNDPTFPAAVDMDPDSSTVRFARFLTSTIMNVALQFQSSFVAMLALSALSPESDTFSVIAYATYGIALLWMLNESVRR